MKRETVWICQDPACQPVGWEKLQFDRAGIIAHLTSAHGIERGSYGTKRLVYRKCGGTWSKKVWMLCLGTASIEQHTVTEYEGGSEHD